MWLNPFRSFCFTLWRFDPYLSLINFFDGFSRVASILFYRLRSSRPFADSSINIPSFHRMCLSPWIVPFRSFVSIFFGHSCFPMSSAIFLSTSPPDFGLIIFPSNLSPSSHSSICLNCGSDIRPYDPHNDINRNTFSLLIPVRSTRNSSILLVVSF